MPVAQDLAGRRAVVTGAGRGLGRAIAERLAASGASILAIDLPAALEDLPGDWEAVPIDLVAADAGDQLAAAARGAGRVDIVVANAGAVPPWRGVEEIDRTEWERVMTLNTWAVAATLGAFAPCLARSDHASAIAMASINGYKAHPKQVLYTASKHAVIGIMRAAALDLGAKGIRVNALAPGPIATEALLSRVAARLIDFSWSREVWLLLMRAGALVAASVVVRLALEAWSAAVVGSLVAAVGAVFCLRGLASRLGDSHRLVRICTRIPVLRYFLLARIS